MRHHPIAAQLFIENRQRLSTMLPENALVIVNANDLSPTNGDAVQCTVTNSDLFYLTGIDQEQTTLVICPGAVEKAHREILFLREPTDLNQLWEGHKLSKEEARAITGIDSIHWLSDFPLLLHRLMCESESVLLNSNEHPRAVIEVESRDARFANVLMQKYPLHDYRRLAKLMHRLRSVKSATEIELLRRACEVTGHGFQRVMKFTRPGVTEYEIEAEFSHEFISRRGRFAYLPIIASGMNACCLHYVSNRDTCRDGDLLLLDVAASYANYNADMTRTIPVNGRFTPRQKKVYQSVLKVLQETTAALTPGKSTQDWQKEAEQLMERELVNLGLISLDDIRDQKPGKPAFRKYFMHGVGHPLGLDVHDVADARQSIQEGWVMTVEPGIYIPEEGFAIRLENDVLVTADGPVDLMSDIPIEPDQIEDLMNR